MQRFFILIFVIFSFVFFQLEIKAEELSGIITKINERGDITRNTSLDLLGAKINLGFGDHQIDSDISISSISDNNSNLSKSDAYQAIVKIKSYTLNQNNELILFSSGSGVIIDPSGIVLTNHHVVVLEDDFDNTERDSSYMICLAEEIDDQPNCLYTGKLIDSNENLDVALLQIENISGYSHRSNFPYLNLNTTSSVDVNDEVTALGYPAIGGDTITVTKGVISGKEKKHNKSWLKTDAIISYGSSGGAAIDRDANIIGITSSAHSDSLGSLGYIIEVASIEDWLDGNINKTPRTNSLTNRMIRFAKKKLNVGNSNEFVNVEPAYRITKPSDWQFIYEDEATLAIENKNDDSGGGIVILNTKFPYLVDTDIVEAAIKRDLLFWVSMVSIVKNEEVVINGNEARKVMISSAGEQQTSYYIPVDNYLLKIVYSYGFDDKDEATVNKIISSIALTDSNYIEKKEYSHDDPKFSIKMNGAWVLLENNSKRNPVFIANKSIKSAFSDIEIVRTDNDTENLNNEEYLSIILQTIKEANSFGSLYDIKSIIHRKDAHYKLNDNLSDVIMIESVDESISTDQILVQTRSYFIKASDNYIIVSLNYFGEDDDHYNRVLDKFNNMLSSFTLGEVDIMDDEEELEIEEELEDEIETEEELEDEIETEEELEDEVSIGQKEYYLNLLGDDLVALKKEGVVINNADLSKIPIGLSNLSGLDTDRDGLPDLFEDAIGTNKNIIDTDGDGYSDMIELKEGYNPDGSDKLVFNMDFSNRQKGKIFLQAENNGEVWYVNPSDGKRYFLGRPVNGRNVNISRETSIKNDSMYKKLKGKIMLTVESNGEAYYIHPSNYKKYYLGFPDDAFIVMREQGVGISNANLVKIPVGLDNLTGADSDGDGLSDLFEDAIGTNKNKADSDSDGYNDKTELLGNYNPNGSSRLNVDNNFSDKQKGKIFLQVENNGEAWYVNPSDGKRYFLGRPTDAFAVMRNLGLGISNGDFDKL